MKPDQRKTLTLGDLIASVYSLYNRRKAKAIVRFAINQHMIVFRGQQRFVVD